MDNLKQKEVNLLDLQNITTAIFIISLLISIYITSIDKKSTLNPNIKYPDTSKISIFNRTLVVILSLSYLYISYNNRKIAIQKGKKLNLSNLQVLASQISLVSTLIVLYVVIKSCGDNYNIIIGSGNPNL